MINEDLLTEKLKYLITNDLNEKFVIQEFVIEYFYADKGKRLVAYDVNIDFEYNGAINSMANVFGLSVHRVLEELENKLSEWGFTVEGKLTDNTSTYYKEMEVYKLSFVVENTHDFGVTYQVKIF